MSGPAQPYGDQQPEYGHRYAPPAGGQSVGIAGIALAVVGAILIVIAYTSVDWYKRGTGDGPSHVSNIHDALGQLDKLHAASGLSVAYFGWLCWLLLILGVLTAAVACVPGAASAAFRAIGALVAAAGIVLTLLAIKITSGQADNYGYGDYLRQSRLGFYLALAGFLLVGVGALVGPSRRA